MSNLVHAIDVIRKYEGFNEKAYADPETGDMPYTIGFGTQYYPDGAPVKRGHCCTREKALEYLQHEIMCIGEDLDELELDLNESMRSALISFIHSVGWKPFLYSSIIDHIESHNWSGVVNEISLWVFDKNHQIIGSLLERRREESCLFLDSFNTVVCVSGQTLLNAFREYAATPSQLEAIQVLETKINPYVLAEFANAFKKDIYGLPQGSSDGF